MNVNTINPFASVVAALSMILFAAGCQSGTEPSSSGIPIGLYASESTATRGGVETRQVRTILLPSQLEGRIYDTLFTLRNGVWQADTMAETELHFQLVGDGYQRTVEVHHTMTAPADSSIGYWYFFRRGDSLYYYTGQRLLGNSPGLVGSWESDARDTAFSHRYYALHFTHDSVGVTYKAHPVGDLSGMYTYQAAGNSLTIQGLPLSLGSRYEIVPGWSLYLTSQATHGFKAR
jgi:hypothetical protein